LSTSIDVGQRLILILVGMVETLGGRSTGVPLCPCRTTRDRWAYGIICTFTVEFRNTVERKGRHRNRALEKREDLLESIWKLVLESQEVYDSGQGGSSL